MHNRGLGSACEWVRTVNGNFHEDELCRTFIILHAALCSAKTLDRMLALEDMT